MHLVQPEGVNEVRGADQQAELAEVELGDQYFLVALPREFAVSVLSGPGGSRNSWFLGMAPADNPQYVAVLTLEGEADPAVAERIGRELLQASVSPP